MKIEWNVNTRIVIERHWGKYEAELRQYEASFRWKVLTKAKGDTPELALTELMKQIMES